MHTSKNIALNTLFQIIAKGATSGASFLFTILIARSLGVMGYGDFAKITAFVSLFYLFIDFGLNAIFLQKEDSKIRFKELFYGRIFFGIICMGLVNIVATLLPYNTLTQIGYSPLVHLGIFIYSATLLTEGITYTASAIFQREHAYKHLAVASLLSSLILLLCLIFVKITGQGLLVILFMYVFVSFVRAIISLWLTREKITPFIIDRDFTKKLIIEAFPITLVLVFNVIYFRIDMLLLSLMKSSSDVAMYNLAYSFFDSFLAIPLFLSNALYPILLHDEKNGQHSPLIYLRYAGVFVLFSFIIVLPGWALSPFLTWIRPDFAPAAITLRIFFIGVPLFFATNIFQWLLIAKKQQKFLAVVYFVAMVINILANIIFIPQYSYLASAIITGLSEGLVLILLAWKLFLNKIIWQKY